MAPSGRPTKSTTILVALLVATGFFLLVGKALHRRVTVGSFFGPSGTSCAGGALLVQGDRVRDTRRWITWQRTSPPEHVVYAEAERRCAALQMRLPNVGELQDLMQTGPSEHEPLDSCAFPGAIVVKNVGGLIVNEDYWTSVEGIYISGIMGKPNQRMVVGGHDTFTVDETEEHLVRCVIGPP